MPLPIRPGMTIPLPGPLHAQRDQIVELADLGFTDVWTAESDGGDGLTPLALASVWEPRLRLGTAILPAYTRAPAVWPRRAATMADAAPGRFVLGIGSSSNVIVERWNGVPFEQPYQRVRDMVRFLRDAFTGEKVTQAYDTFEIQGFRLGVHPEQPPTIVVAALREGMLKMAGRESDGAITNWLAPGDVPRVAAAVREGSGGEDRELVARIFVCPSDNAEVVRAGARRAIAAYMNVPVYAAFQEWLGRGEQLAGMWAAWKAGDRQQALAEIPDSGRRRPGRARHAGAVPGADPGVFRQRRSRPVRWRFLPFDPELDHWTAIRSLAPNAG